MNSSAFIHKTEKFHSAETQELPEASLPHAHIAGCVRLKSNQWTFPLLALTSISAFAGKLTATAWTPSVHSKQTSGFRQHTKWASASSAAGHPHHTQHPRLQPPLPGLGSALHSIHFKNYINVTKRHSHSTRPRNICYFNVWVNWNRAEGHSQGFEDFRH